MRRINKRKSSEVRENDISGYFLIGQNVFRITVSE